MNLNLNLHSVLEAFARGTRGRSGADPEPIRGFRRFVLFGGMCCQVLQIAAFRPFFTCKTLQILRFFSHVHTAFVQALCYSFFCSKLQCFVHCEHAEVCKDYAFSACKTLQTLHFSRSNAAVPAFLHFVLPKTTNCSVSNVLSTQNTAAKYCKLPCFVRLEHTKHCKYLVFAFTASSVL